MLDNLSGRANINKTCRLNFVFLVLIYRPVWVNGFSNSVQFFLRDCYGGLLALSGRLSGIYVECGLKWYSFGKHLLLVQVLDTHLHLIIL